MSESGSMKNSLPVRCVLVHDEQGVMAQCLVPTDSMLELGRLQASSGHDLNPMPSAQILRASKMRRLVPLGKSRQFFTLPTWVDQSLAARGDLVVDADGMTLQQVRDGLLEQRMSIRHVDITIAATELDHSLPAADQDSEQINDSLRNFTSLRIRQRLDDTLEIPPLSPTADRIMQLRANPNASVTDLTNIVESDPSLAAQVVSWASSPYYAAPGKIRSVQDAIVRVLGFDLVSNLAVGLILGRTVSLPKDSSDGLTPYWLQAAYCATTVEALSRLMPARVRPRQGLIYLSGLLHNFGYLVLAHTFPPHFSRICRYAEANPNISHVAIEKHLVGICREQISAWLMQAWNMPEEVCTALRHQQDADYQGEHAEYANLVFIATRLLREHGIGDAPTDPIPDEMFDRRELNPERCRELVDKLVASDDIALIAEQMTL
jgi:HD-like signal output (HDOD) protein